MSARKGMAPARGAGAGRHVRAGAGECGTCSGRLCTKVERRLPLVTEQQACQQGKLLWGALCRPPLRTCKPEGTRDAWRPQQCCLLLRRQLGWLGRRSVSLCRCMLRCPRCLALPRRRACCTALAERLRASPAAAAPGPSSTAMEVWLASLTRDFASATTKLQTAPQGLHPPSPAGQQPCRARLPPPPADPAPLGI